VGFQKSAESIRLQALPPARQRNYEPKRHEFMKHCTKYRGLEPLDVAGINTHQPKSWVQNELI
jgi:hypothetical protein